MMALLHHPAYAAEACTASRVVSPQGEAFQMRQDRVHMVAKRPHLILVGAVCLGRSDPATAKERLQALQQSQVLLVQREREGGPDLKARPQLRPDGKRDAEASLAIRETRDVPGIQRLGVSVGASCFDEGRRLARRMVFRTGRSTTPLSFRISR